MEREGLARDFGQAVVFHGPSTTSGRFPFGRSPKFVNKWLRILRSWPGAKGILFPPAITYSRIRRRKTSWRFTTRCGSSGRLRRGVLSHSRGAWLAQTPFCGVCDAPQGHVGDRPAHLPPRQAGPFGKSQTPQNGVCASPFGSLLGMKMTPLRCHSEARSLGRRICSCLCLEARSRHSMAVAHAACGTLKP